MALEILSHASMALEYIFKVALSAEPTWDENQIVIVVFYFTRQVCF